MKRVLVTGGGGFLGQAITHQLLAKGYQVVVFNRKNYPDLQALGVICLQGDVTNQDQIVRAAQSCDAIIHTAAKAGVWGAKSEYQAINVEGTKNVIEACRIQNIRYLVHTSSPSVVFNGDNQNGLDESTPYPKRFLAAYPETKATAEQLVIGANSADLATVALRPHLIWGPRDPHLAPRLIERAKQGRLRLIDKGQQLVDTVFIDNAAAAHILALEKLQEQGSIIAGKSYFITNQEPWPMQQVVTSILTAAGLSGATKNAPYWLGKFMAHIFEGSYRLFNIRQEPPLTRFVVKQLATAHWYDPARAKNELGFRPKVSMAQGMARLAEYYQSLSLLSEKNDKKQPANTTELLSQV